MATWQAIVGGATYNLSDRAPFDVVTVTGVGSAPVRRLSQRGPLQHGETDIGFRLDPRSINLVLAFAPATLALADAARDTLARIFGPRQSIPVQLRYTRDDAAVRQLDCYAVGMVDMPVTEEDRIGVLQRVAVQLQASAPAWYDPEQKSLRVAGSIAGTPSSVPLAMPWVVGGASVAGSYAVSYMGTFDEYPIIVVTGPITDPVITNTTTGDALSFVGTTIANGDSYTIDLRYGFKTVTDSGGTNRIAKLTTSSALATWRLASLLETSDGNNGISISGTGAGAATTVRILYSNRYLSL